MEEANGGIEGKGGSSMMGLKHFDNFYYERHRSHLQLAAAPECSAFWPTEADSGSEREM
jgi:hypothetical protein